MYTWSLSLSIESWVQVEEGEGHTAAHGGGSEEVSKLLAAAAEEDPTRWVEVKRWLNCDTALSLSLSSHMIII